MSGVPWIKIRTDMFSDEKIRLIEALPEADSILIIWVKLLTLAGMVNSNGQIFVNDEMPYTDEMLVTMFNRKLNTVRMALKTFERFRMIEILEDKTIVICNWGKHQNLEGLDRIRRQNLERKRKQRAQLLERRLMLRARAQESANNGDAVDNAVDAMSRDGHVTQHDAATQRSVTVTPQEQESKIKSTELPSTVSHGETNKDEFSLAKKWLNSLFGRQREWSSEELQLLADLLPIDKADRALLSWAYALSRDAEGWAMIDGKRANKPKMSLVALLREFSSEIDKWLSVRSCGKRPKKDIDETLPAEWIPLIKKLYGDDVPIPRLKRQLPLSVLSEIDAAIRESI